MAVLPSTIMRKWYTTGWGIVGLGFGGMVLAIILLFAGFTGYYFWQLKHGNIAAPTVAKRQFSALSTSATSATSVRVDPKKVFSATAPAWGQAPAPVTIVEFLDFKCPYCKAAVATMRQVVQKYPGKVQLVIRQFPIESIHPGANRLALAGFCAAKQGKFQPVHDLLYNQQDTIAANAINEDIIALLSSLGMNSEVFLTCMDSSQALQGITKDYADGLSAGVNGTPTFFVNGERIEGPQPLEWWTHYIDSLP